MLKTNKTVSVIATILLVALFGFCSFSQAQYADNTGIRNITVTQASTGWAVTTSAGYFYGAYFSGATANGYIEICDAKTYAESTLTNKLICPRIYVNYKASATAGTSVVTTNVTQITLSYMTGVLYTTETATSVQVGSGIDAGTITETNSAGIIGFNIAPIKIRATRGIYIKWNTGTTQNTSLSGISGNVYWESGKYNR